MGFSDRAQWLARGAALFVGMTFLAACENKPSPGQAAVDRARLCSEAGATLDAATNECKCAQGSKWSGTRCDAEQTAAGSGSPQPPPPEPAPVLASTALVDPVPEMKVGDAAASLEPLPQDEKLRTACKAAKAKFDEKNGYCLCKQGLILDGKRCVALAGSASKDVCTRAIHPGKWKKNECQCAAAQIFSPNLGGCLAARPLGDLVARRICESTLNKGKWDAREARCNCPKERVWSGAQCMPQRELTSRQVCESDYNRGAWDKTKKRCDCPEGKTWSDQRCRLLATVDPKMACESEANGGKWEAGVSLCLCPGKFKWDKKSLVCR